MLVSSVLVLVLVHPAPSRAEWVELSDDGDPRALARAVQSSLAKVSGRRARVSPAERDATATLRAFAHALARDPDPARAAAAAQLQVRADMPAVVTGYYEPTIDASERRTERFRYPLLEPPRPSAQRGPTRREIETGALAGRGLEMYWADDPIELYFLQIQGSGRLRLANGRTVRVGFAGSNGWPYKSIGKLLLERGVFPSGQGASAPAIKQYLRSHPEVAADVMRENPRYVFFRRLDVPPYLGPPGALGAPLVPFRSVAIDPRDVPLGSLGFLTVPLDASRTLSAFVVAMDTGAAIVGRGRLDLFMGEGARVEHMAGELHARGRIIWLTAHPQVSPGVR